MIKASKNVVRTFRIRNDFHGIIGKTGYIELFGRGFGF
jgi:hypothetical protein